MPRHRIGLIVPNSNTTMETELPLLLGAHRDATFTFHSSRVQLKAVDEKSLSAMNDGMTRCAEELRMPSPTL